MTSFSPTPSGPTRIEFTSVFLLAALTVMSAAGYATFALHPERLSTAPTSALVYGYALRWFPPGHIIVGAIALGAVLMHRVRFAWIPAAMALYALSLCAELLGTTVGVPFGPYSYTDGLGIKWFDHVPVLIPLSWFVMALPSYALATRWISRKTSLRIVSATVLLVAWDLALDPAMSHLMPYWIWSTEGTYYGMPLLNLAGWFVTGLVLMTALSLLKVDRWLAQIPTWTMFGLYAANLALPVAMSAAAGLWPAALLAILPVAFAGTTLRARQST